jgi:sporulation protein YlmC with PRC-barrel domain
LSKYDLYYGKLCTDLLENFLTVEKERCREQHSPGLAPLFHIPGTAIAFNGLPAAKDSSRCLIRQNVGTKTVWVQKCAYLHISIHLSRKNSMKKATITFIASAALAFALPLYTADKPVKSDSEQQAEVTQQGMKSDTEQNAGLNQHRNGQMITADKLQGMEVVTPQEGEELGEIQKITIDKQSGEVQFVTFTKGGILGMGAEEIAARLSAFEIRDDKPD